MVRDRDIFLPTRWHILVRLGWVPLRIPISGSPQLLSLFVYDLHCQVARLMTSHSLLNSDVHLKIMAGSSA